MKTMNIKGLALLVLLFSFGLALISCSSDEDGSETAKKFDRVRAVFTLEAEEVDFRDKYTKQQVFDNKYKLLCTINYELGSSKAASGSEYPSDNGTANFLKSVYKYANGSNLDLLKVIGVDSEQMSNTLESFINMISEAKSHYNLPKAVGC